MKSKYARNRFVLGLHRFTEWLSQRLELSHSGSAHNIRPMEGLRGAAALLVFFVHYCYYLIPVLEPTSISTKFIRHVDTIGNSGVDLFFVLSGYLIYGSLFKKPQSYIHFMQRRIARIYPVFLVVFAIYLVLSLILSSESRIPASPSEAVGFLSASLLLLAPLFVAIVPLVPVTWSLSYELFYYALTPLLISGFRLRRKSVTWRVTLFLILTVAYTVYCAFYGGHPRLIMFVAGILLYETLNHALLRPPNSVATLAICLLGLVAFVLLSSSGRGEVLQAVVLLVVYFSLCFCCFAPQKTWLARAFGWTPLRWFGNMSYSFYLIHALAMTLTARVIFALLPTVASSSALAFLLLLPVFFIASLVPAFLLYNFVERPFSLKKTRSARSLQPPYAPVPDADAHGECRQGRGVSGGPTAG